MEPLQARSPSAAPSSPLSVATYCKAVPRPKGCGRTEKGPALQRPRPTA